MSNANTDLLIRIRTDLGNALNDLNRVAGGVNGVGGAAQRATGAIHPMMLALSSPRTQLAESMAATARASAAARAEIERTASAELGLANASRGLATEQINLRSALTSAFSGAPESVGATGTAIAGLKSQLLGLIAIYQLLQAAKKVVSDTADLQDAETRLKSLTVESEKYAQTERYLTGTADRLHKQYLTLADSYNRLLALQKAGVITQKEGRSILEGLAEASSELGVSNSDLALSMRGIIQQLGNSTVQWDEMRQATDPVPGLLQNIAKASGLSVGEMKALAETGAYTTSMFRDHLIKALEAYKGASERTSQNIHAKYTDISNAYTELVKVLEEPISDALTPLLTGLADRIKQIANGPSLQDKIDELNMLKAASSKDASRFLANSSSPDQDEIRRRRGATAPAAPDRIAVLEAEIAAVQKRDAADKAALETQDQKDKAARQVKESIKALADTEDWYAETVIADEKQTREAKEESAKKAKSAADSAAKAYQNEREAIAKNIDQLNHELAALKLSDEERAIQIKLRSLGAKATDDEKVKLEADIRALDKATTAQKRLNDAKEQQVKDAFSYADLHREIAEAAVSNDQSLSSFSANLAKIQDISKQLDLSPAQTKEMYDMLGKGFNEGFIDPATSGVSQLSEFSVQAAHNMQSAFADYLFEPMQGGFDGMVEGFAKALRRMMAEAASAQIFNALLGKDFSKSGDLQGGLLSGLGTAIAGAFAGGVSTAGGNSEAFSATMSDPGFWTKKRHVGGIVGQAGAGVYADPALFSGATRYHSGGIAGLKPNEEPTILLKGEEVLTETDPRHRNNLSGASAAAPTVEVHIHEAPGTKATATSQQTNQGTQISVMIEQIENAIGAGISRGTGLAPVLEKQYGLNRSAGSF